MSGAALQAKDKHFTDEAPLAGKLSTHHFASTVPEDVGEHRRLEPEEHSNVGTSGHRDGRATKSPTAGVGGTSRSISAR